MNPHCQREPLHRCQPPPLCYCSPGFHRRASQQQLRQRARLGSPPSAGVNGHVARPSSTLGASDADGPSDLQRTLAEDPWVARTLSSCSTVHLPGTNQWLRQMRQSNLQALQTQRMPTTRNEAYRFTDVSPILRSTFQMAAGSDDVTSAHIQSLPLSEAEGSRVVLIDGRMSPHLSDLSAIPDDIFVGSIADAPEHLACTLDQQARRRGGPFALVNAATAQDVVCVHVPEGVALEQPLHILHLSTGALADVSLSSPRLLLHLAPGASLAFVQEYAPAEAASAYFCNAVAELELEAGAQLTHRYVQLEDAGAWHMQGTLVRQGRGSTYELTEASLGSAIARHDINIEQAGEATHTCMRSFLLCGEQQLHDLHSRLTLEHPEGTAYQLHKCIAASPSGRGVFDGNVKVNRLAQRTDAAQLSRNLLLVPKATVNVKPNLQIVADDVKCSHGCTVSDLEDEQLFYFRARGIDDGTARRILVFSFGSEVTQHFHHKQLLQRIEARVAAILAPTVNTITVEAGADAQESVA